MARRFSLPSWLRAFVVNTLSPYNMPTISITLDCPIRDSFRVRQVAGMFDLPVESSCAETFTAEVPDASEPWDIGVIVGPSGSGKTTIARAAFGEAIYQPTPWPDDRATIDCFGDHPIKRIVRVLTSVGFSSPPSWLKPYAVLSNGEKFRCELARAMLGKGTGTGTEAWCGKGTEARRHVGTKGEQEAGLSALCLRASVPPCLPPLVFDEFTSVVDRTVARIGSAAIAKAIRGGSISIRFVAVTCHYDVVRWLQPDWVLDMSGPSLKRGRVRWTHRGQASSHPSADRTYRPHNLAPIQASSLSERIPASLGILFCRID